MAAEPSLKRRAYERNHVSRKCCNLIDATMGREGQEGGRKVCRF